MATDSPQIDLNARRKHLARFQNADGGWGYFPGKESWLEPTVYGALALQGQSESKRAIDLLARWQLPDGAWHANAKVKNPYWGTALMLTLYRATGRRDASYARALEWLAKTTGAEGSLPVRIVQRFQARIVDQDETIHGWPWRPGNSSWVEPTAHALVALKQSPRAGELADRIAEGEGYLFNRRCPDGGWNYGNKRVYYTDMTSFPETTGLALLGLQGRGAKELKPSIERALSHAQTTKSGLARAWLTIALRTHSVKVEGNLPTALAPGGDLAVTALELLAYDPAVANVFQVGRLHS